MSAFDSRRRDPHPVADLALAMENQRQICVPRGYCGPFINESYYAAFPDPVWHGMADCCVCGNSCRVEAEEEKRCAALAAASVAQRAQPAADAAPERARDGTAGKWREADRNAPAAEIPAVAR